MSKLKQTLKLKNRILFKQKTQVKRFFAERFFPEGFLPLEEKAQAERFFPEGFLPLEEKAQAEAVFRLMIDSVVGLAILLIILSALSYFQNQVIVQSKSDFFSLVSNAVNTPTGIVLKSNELTFTSGFVVDDIELRDHTQLSENCFKLDSRGSIVTTDEKKVEFTQKITTIVYAKCISVPGCNIREAPQGWGDCCTQCYINFGKPLTAD